MFAESTPILEGLRDAGLELDQRLYAALSASAHRWAASDQEITDYALIYELALTNPSIDPALLSLVAGVRPDRVMRDEPSLVYCSVEDVRCDNVGVLGRILAKSVKIADHTLSASALLKAVLADPYGEDYYSRSFTIDALLEAKGYDHRDELSKHPDVELILKSLPTVAKGGDDFQYVLAIASNRLVFRVVSKLDDFVQESGSGLWVPERALLTHLGDIGLFSQNEIGELEELINSPSAIEADFQDFFERHPHFLRKWDHRDVFPHVYLSRQEDGPLIPDFILTNAEAQDAAIVDLKLANSKKKLVRRQSNRERFADAVMEARAQLLEYRDWFDIPANRQHLRRKVGMEVYRPRLMVVIGRASEFRDEIERQKLRARASDIEVATYDDILRYAKERSFLLRRD